MEQLSPSSAVVRRVHLPDAQAMQEFVLRLGKEARRNRFHGTVNNVSDSLVRGLVGADGEHRSAWVACIWGEHGEEIVGEAMWYAADPAERIAELAISVRDDWQGRGVADQLIRAVVQSLRGAGMRQVYGDVLIGNARMLAFMRRHGLEEGVCDGPPDHGSVRVGLVMAGPSTSKHARRPVSANWWSRMKARWR